jgi:hypothetical protein
VRPSRRALVGLAAAATLAAPLRAAPLRAAPRVRLARGVSLFPWFSLTRELPAPSPAYGWPPFQEGRPTPSARDLAVLRRAGFDHVRLPFDPGPFLAFEGARRRELIAALLAAVDLCVAQGLAVVVTATPNAATHHWTPARLTAGLDAPGFRALVGLLAEIAAALARRDLSRVALEPMNEPTMPCASPLWPELQDALVAAVRTRAPGLVLVLTGACGSLVASLEHLDPRRHRGLDAYYTVHFYEPYVFTHQGAGWMPPLFRHLAAVPWPGAREATRAALDRSLARLAADARLPPADRARVEAEIRRALRDYEDGAPDVSYLRPFFRDMTAWTVRHGIAPERLYLGEFGVVRAQADGDAARPEDRRRWVRDVRLLAEEAGFSWCFWNLFDRMGLFLDDRRREIDPGLAAALGLSA